MMTNKLKRITVAMLALTVVVTGSEVILSQDGANPAPAADKAKETAVRRISLDGVKVDQTRSGITMLTRIANVHELALVCQQNDSRERLAKQVDFSKEDLLVYHWTSVCRQGLAVSTMMDQGKLLVVFKHPGPVQRCPVDYLDLYAVPKGAGLRIN